MEFSYNSEALIATDNGSRVNMVDKRIINGQTDVNQLVPFKYKYEEESFIKDDIPETLDLEAKKYPVFCPL